MGVRVHIRTVGCRTNQADSLALARRVQVQGGRVTDDASEADVVVVNSCAVTTRAARDVRRILGQVRREAPRARIVVAGCLASLDESALFESLGADEVVPGADHARILDLVRGLVGDPGHGPPAAAHPPLATARPALKVQQGCEVGCAYCVVPTTRGPERSVAAPDVLSGIADLAASGAREVVLTGTQLGSWGRDLTPPSRLSALVQAVLDARLVPRIRLSSIEPWGVDGALVEMLSSGSQGLCAHLHLPLQSGSDRVLGEMRRPGSVAAWLRIVADVTALRPDLAVGTDVLVGFPGETEDDFDLTRDAIAQARVAYLHVFPFSPRPGTPAERLGGLVPERVAARRVAALRALSRTKRQAFLEALPGTTLEVVLERPARAGGMLGTSSQYARVRVVDADASLAGRLARVRAHEVEPERLVGVIEKVIH